MDATTLEMFKRELEKQCRFALMAYNDLMEILKQVLKAKKAEDIKRQEVERIWCSIHAFLMAAGNISKIFWPPKSKYSQRGDELRKSLSVDGDSPLGIRKPRNYLEHFDEYLQEWIESTKNYRYIDTSFGSLKLIKVLDPDFENGDFLRFFDYQLRVIVFSKFSFDLKPIIKAIDELLTKVRR
jgi:hypothetical protein